MRTKIDGVIDKRMEEQCAKSEYWREKLVVVVFVQMGSCSTSDGYFSHLRVILLFLITPTTKKREGKLKGKVCTWKC